MQNKEFIKYHPLEEIDMSYEDVLDLVDKLSDEEKQQLTQHLLGGNNSPLTVVLGGYNVINNSVALQLNGEVEKIAEQLEKVSPETLQKLLEAIALRIGNKKPSK